MSLEKDVSFSVKTLVDNIKATVQNNLNEAVQKGMITLEDNKVEGVNRLVIHKVFDICKSEILHSKEDLKTLISKKDIQMMLPNKLSEILDSYDVDLPTWEQAHFIIKNKLWNSQILISRDETDYEETGKVLKIINLNDFVIDVQTTQKYIGDFENE